MFTARLVNVTDCNSLVICLTCEEDERMRFIDNIHDMCNRQQWIMHHVEGWMVNIGDCFIVFDCFIGKWLRCKVVKV